MGAARMDAKAMAEEGNSTIIALDQYTACVAMHLATARGAFSCGAHVILSRVPGFLHAIPAVALFTELVDAAPPAAAAASAAADPWLAAASCDLSYEELQAIFFEELDHVASGQTVGLDTRLDDAGLDSLAGIELRSRIAARTGHQISRELLLASHATVGTVLQGFYEQLGGSTGGKAIVVKEEDLSESAKRILQSEKLLQGGGLNFDPSGLGGLSPSSIPSAPLADQILFVLSSPRSGSSLLQLCLNVHPQLVAGQEITLLMFETLKARKTALEGQFIYGGLAQCFMELWGLESEQAAQERLDGLGDDFWVWQTYQLLQQLSAPRIFVDKTPGNSSQLLTLIRAQMMFDSAIYLHIIRHPYACISSGVELARDYVGAADVSWEDVEDELYIRINSNCSKFQQIYLPSLGPRFMQVRYEDFVTDPAEMTRRICSELLSIPWMEAMQNPYSSDSIKSFSGKTAATDPKLLRHKSIDARQADKWREVAVPQRLKSATVALAQLYKYELPDEAMRPEVVWLSRAKLAKSSQPSKPPILCIHDFTGLLWGFRGIVTHLKVESCIGMTCSEHLLKGCSDMYQLASKYLEALPSGLWAAGEHIRIVAYSLGCRVAYWMACLLEAQGRVVSLAVLDGPLCGDAGYPARMGGATPLVAVHLRHQTGVEECEDAEMLEMFERANTGEGAALVPVIDRILKAGTGAAAACARLLELPDQAPQDAPKLQGPVLVISPEKSNQRTNGTIEQVLKCVPQATVIADLRGSHFNFVTLDAEQVARQLAAWSAWWVL